MLRAVYPIVLYMGVLPGDRDRRGLHTPFRIYVEYVMMPEQEVAVNPHYSVYMGTL